MGIASKKLTRRVAFSAIAGGLLTAPPLLRLLIGKPDDISTEGSHELVLQYRGVTASVEVPAGASKEEAEAIIRDSIKNDPRIAEIRAMRLEEAKRKAFEKRMARLDDEEKGQLEMIENSPLEEQAKEKLRELVRKTILASRESAKTLMEATQ